MVQREFKPVVSCGYGSIDYREFHANLTKIEEILRTTALAARLVRKALEQYVIDNKLDAQHFYNSKSAATQYTKMSHALRCNIARHLTGAS